MTEAKARGCAVVLPEDSVRAAQDSLRASGLASWVCGRVHGRADQRVQLVGEHA